MISRRAHHSGGIVKSLRSIEDLKPMTRDERVFHCPAEPAGDVSTICHALKGPLMSGSPRAIPRRGHRTRGDVSDAALVAFLAAGYEARHALDVVLGSGSSSCRPTRTDSRAP